ncbi:MAG: leucine-rich repeat protein [Clostridia bacterium]|nr:leucine-rich repeat protein [Clostridia bacterium]
MKNKFIKCLALIILLIPCIFVFSACGKTEVCPKCGGDLSCSECDWTIPEEENPEDSELKLSDFVKFNTAHNGTVQKVAENDGVTDAVYVPVPDAGYYFYKWEEKVYLNGELNSTRDSYSSYIPVNCKKAWFYEYTPVFTNDASLFTEYEMTINIDSDAQVEVNYLPYYVQGQIISFYIEKNDDIMLKSWYYSSTEPSGAWGGNIVWNDRTQFLPAATNSFVMDGTVLESITINLIDVSQKSVITIQEEHNGEIAHESFTEYRIFENGEKATLSVGLYTSPAYLYAWKNSDGEIISYNETLDIVANEDATYVAVYRNGDYLYGGNDANNPALVFSENTDGTLTLETTAIVAANSDLVIPSTVEGKTVTGISNYAFSDLMAKSITIPQSVVNFGEYAFANIKSYLQTLTIEGDKQNLEFSMFNCAFRKAYAINITNNTLKSMVNNLVKTFVNTTIDVEFVSEEHLGENTLGHYESGSKKICILEKATPSYTMADFWVIAHEVRHFYQNIAMGNVTGLTVDSLLYKPTDNQLGAWKNLEYTNSNTDYDKYWYNATEIDAREFATELLGYQYVTKLEK